MTIFADNIHSYINLATRYAKPGKRTLYIEKGQTLEPKGITKREEI